MYLDFKEYSNIGGTLDATTFNRFECEASSQIDYRTFNRLEGETEIPYKVKMLDFKLIELLQKKASALSLGKGEGSEGAYITKQSNDGVSTDYSGIDAADLYTSVKEEADRTINFYLSGVKNSKGQFLTYRGLYANE